MKNTFLVLILALGTSKVFAQINVKEGTKAIAGANNNTLNVMIKGGETKVLSKEVHRFMKDMGCKVTENKDGTLFGDDCSVKSVGPNTFDVYGRMDPIPGEGIDVVLAFDLGGAFLASTLHPDRYVPIKEMVYKFAVEKTRDVIGIDIKKVEQVIVDKEKEQGKLEADKAKLMNDLDELNLKIVGAETAITAKKSEVQAQRDQITQLERKRYDVK